MKMALVAVPLLLASALAGCDGYDRAVFSTPHDFPDRKYANLTILIKDPAQHHRAEQLCSEVVQVESEMTSRMGSPEFKRLPIERRIDIMNSMRGESFELMSELRAIIDANR